MNITQQIMDSGRIVKLRHEARRIDGYNHYSTKMARAKRNLANELERELRFDAHEYYGGVS